MDIATYKASMDRSEPSPELIHVAKSRMRASIANDKSGKDAAYNKTTRRPRFAVVAAAVILLVALGTGVLAFGAEITDAVKSFIFGNSSAEQVDELEDIEWYGGIITGRLHSWELVNRSGLVDETKHAGYEIFDTLDEANGFANFTIKAPSYLPENAYGPVRVAVQKYIDGTAGYEAHVTLHTERQDGNMAEFHLIQMYAGPDSHFNLVTVYPIEKVMVGDIEASLVHEPSEPGDYFVGVGYRLFWMKDEILYQLECSSSSNHPKETILAIAESVR